MQNAPKPDSDGKNAPGEAELHPPPSMWWFVIPLVLLAAYALLSK